ncbi:MAG: tRNA pseudouridine(38-40) synthase TruA [Candidatus Delongbacteria bacterium]|nr:tRNA pseudouridine(38-40) synthase TruA [Candidatus Delongbacteria bacterium]
MTLLPERSFALEIAYDGTDFVGWQIQPGQRSVQGTIQDWLCRILDQKITLTGAGRTDTGVHAEGSLCSFPARTLVTRERLLKSVRRVLPEDVLVYRLHEFEDQRFSARYSAQAREYRYSLRRGPDPFVRRRAWCVHHELDIGRMREALAALSGTRDCRGFCVTRSLPPTATCEFARAELLESGQELHLHLRADRFLHSQVRGITGTLVEIGRGSFPVERMEEILATGRRDLCGPLAPPEGLHLCRVDYARFRTGLRPGEVNSASETVLPPCVYWEGISRSPRQDQYEDRQNTQFPDGQDLAHRTERTDP